MSIFFDEENAITLIQRCSAPFVAKLIPGLTISLPPSAQVCFLYILSRFRP